jgi:membrane fusion protein (multidrug efflux system)
MVESRVVSRTGPRPPGIATAALVLGLAAAGCGKKDAQAAAPPPSPAVVGKIDKRTVQVIGEFTARTQAPEDVDLRARVEGFLLEQSFEEGRPVKKDQVMFQIDPRTWRANLEVAKAALAKAEADHRLAKEQVQVLVAKAHLEEAKAGLAKEEQDVARLTPLVERDAVPRQDLDFAVARRNAASAQVQARDAELQNTTMVERAKIDQTAAAVGSAKASVALAELDLSYCTVRAPFDGIASRAEVSVGQLVGRGETTLLATVVAIDPIWVNFALSESEYLDLRRRLGDGMGRESPEMELVLADGSVHAAKGKFLMADSKVDVETGTLNLVATFPNPGAFLRPNQFGRLRFSVRKVENAVLIPERALVQMQDARAAYVVGEGNVVGVRMLELGDRVGNEIIVKKGLEGGETIVVEGLQKVRPGMAVTPTDKPPPAEAPGGKPEAPPGKPGDEKPPGKDGR